MVAPRKTGWLPYEAALIAVLLGAVLLAAGPARAGGIDCATLAEWSAPAHGYRVNLHHVFCGEAGRGGRAKGFHAMPGGEAPSTYVSAEAGSRANAAGVYTLRNVELRFAGRPYTKSFSSMFPDNCSEDQVVRSIAYSQANSSGRCASPAWARCGPSGPSAGDRARYCVGADETLFTIATAVLPGDAMRINTGFPIYEP